jgi:hypothetical protein
MSFYNKGDNAFPELAGNAKAVSHISKPLLRIFKHYMDKENTVHKQVKGLLQASIRLDSIITNNWNHWKWPAAEAALFLKTTWEYLTFKTALANHFQDCEHPIRLFHVTIKSHYLIHLALSTFHMNPVLAWNYSGEALMKRVKSLCCQNVRGTPWLKVEPKTMKQYVYGMEFLIDDNRALWR